MSVLKLSTIWDMETVRDAAIAKLNVSTHDDPIFRLVVSRGYDVLIWFVPALNAIARRTARVSHDDIERLRVLGYPGDVLDLVIKIGWVRETYIGQKKPVLRCMDHFVPIETRPKVQEECPGAIYCAFHHMNFPCLGQGYSGGTEQDRAEHDFTSVICDIFECYEDGRQAVSKGWSFAFESSISLTDRFFMKEVVGTRLSCILSLHMGAQCMIANRDARRRQSIPSI
jgi:hypothetical protein